MMPGAMPATTFHTTAPRAACARMLAVDKILDIEILPAHLPALTVEEGLEFMVVHGRVHGVKGDIDQVPGNNVDVRRGPIQKNFNPFKKAMNIGGVDNLHRKYVTP